MYVDDGESFEYRESKYVYVRYNFSNNKLTSNIIVADYPTLAWLERIVILGAPKDIKHAKITSKSKYLLFDINS